MTTMGQGKNFKIQSDAFIARREAKKLKNRLKVKKIQRKKNNGINAGSSLRIKTDTNYSKKRILLEASLLPGLEKVVTLLTKKDQDASLGYQTDNTNGSINSRDSISDRQSNQGHQENQQQHSQEQQQKQKQQKWLDESIADIIEGKKDAIGIFKELRTMQEKIYATKCWQFFESAQKIRQQLVLSTKANQQQEQGLTNQQNQEIQLLMLEEQEEEQKQAKKTDQQNSHYSAANNNNETQQQQSDEEDNNDINQRNLQKKYHQDKDIVLSSKRIQKKTKQSIKKHKQRIKESYDKKLKGQELFLAKQREMLESCNQSKKQNQKNQITAII